MCLLLYKNGNIKFEFYEKDGKQYGKFIHYNEDGTENQIIDCDKVDCNNITNEKILDL